MCLFILNDIDKAGKRLDDISDNLHSLDKEMALASKDIDMIAHMHEVTRDHIYRTLILAEKDAGLSFNPEWRNTESKPCTPEGSGYTPIPELTPGELYATVMYIIKNCPAQYSSTEVTNDVIHVFENDINELKNYTDVIVGRLDANGKPLTEDNIQEIVLEDLKNINE